METSVKIKNNNNNKKIYETSLPTSMINKKNEMRKYKSNAPKQKQSQTDPKQLIDYILSIMI
jgi:hypothetical protein